MSPGMHAVAGDGLLASASGYSLVSTVMTLPAGRPALYRFTITGPDGKPVTTFVREQTKLLHFYAIRADVTGFQHVHPTMAADGTWTARLSALRPGTWRLYAQFTAKDAAGTTTDAVLSRTIKVPGAYSAVALPPASTTTSVDGYTLTVTGRPMAGMMHPLTVAVSKDGQPVTDLQPYLDTYAHVTAIHAGDLAFAHLHPMGAVHGDHGGPNLTLHAGFAKAGAWRLFVQFQTGGVLHTAAVTINVT